MRLVLIFGPPASGKSTIGKELHTLSSYKFFHNHLVVDTVLSLFDFGTAPFVKMREHLWNSLLDEAISAKIPGVIFTFNPENSVPTNYISDLIERLEAQGAEVSLIKITCPENVIEQRIDTPSRHEHKKLTSLPLYQQLRSADVFSDSWMPAPDLTLDSSKYSAKENALKIWTHLKSI